MAQAQFQGVGRTVDEALTLAHRKIPPRSGRDWTTSKVVELGVQFGGFMHSTRFYVVVEEDPNAPFRSDEADDPAAGKQPRS